MKATPESEALLQAARAGATDLVKAATEILIAAGEDARQFMIEYAWHGLERDGWVKPSAGGGWEVAPPAEPPADGVFTLAPVKPGATDTLRVWRVPSWGWFYRHEYQEQRGWRETARTVDVVDGGRVRSVTQIRKLFGVRFDLSPLPRPDHARRDLAATIIDALESWHAREHYCWAFFREFKPNIAGLGRLDGFAMHLWPSKMFQRVAYEVKVARADLLAELKNPEKRAEALEISNLYYLVAPRGLVRLDELPPEAGLMEYSPDFERGFNVRRKAPWRDVDPPDVYLTASIARRAASIADRRDGGAECA